MGRKTRMKAREYIMLDMMASTMLALARREANM